MIEFICRKKASEETSRGVKYEVWFEEKSKLVGVPDVQWKRYEVDREQYDALRIEATYKLTAVHPIS